MLLECVQIPLFREFHCARLKSVRKSRKIIGTTIGLQCFDYIINTTYQNIGDLFSPLHISRLSPSMQYPTPLYHCIDDVICKFFHQKIDRFLDTDLRKQKFRLQCYESKLLKRSKSNETSTLLQFDICNQSKFYHTIDN